MNFDWKKIVKTVAPTLGAVVSGANPLVGLGIKAISEALLGKSDGTEAEIEQAIKNAGPQDLLKLKQADQAFKIEMKKLDIDVTRLDYEDAASARRRQEAVKDKTPDVLAYLLLVAFVGALMSLFVIEIPEANRSLVYSMLGALGTLTIAACAYFHGSSRGSARKEQQINELKLKGV